MSLTPEDKADVKRSLGKRVANKVSKVTRDGEYDFHHSKKFKTAYGTAGGGGYGYKSAAEAKRARAKTEALGRKIGPKEHFDSLKKNHQMHLKTALAKRGGENRYGGEEGATRAANIFSR